MPTVREPAVAGMFYPADNDELRALIGNYLAQAPAAEPTAPRAIIAPHAGYIYSGPVAASAYGQLGRLRERIERVVLLGPSHRVGFLGLAASSAEFYHTPLGDVPVDREAVAELHLPQVKLLDQAHALEHSLEVHLPFLQQTLGEFRLIPLVVGEACAEEVAEVLEALWGGEETLIVVSSDLSHYNDYETAKRMDQATAQLIEQLRYETIGAEEACGCNPLRGLLLAARRKGLRAATLDIRNSGDTAGPRDRVVGYGAWLFQ